MLDNGTLLAPPKPTKVGEVLAAWLATKTQVRPTTLHGYAAVVEKRLMPWLDGTVVSALTREQVRAAITELADAGGKRGGPLSAGTCQLALATLRHALDFAIEQGWAEGNAAADVTVTPGRTQRALSTEVVARTVVAAIRSDRLYALWALYLTRGPRRGELAGLRWEDVDLEAGSLQIAATRGLVGGPAPGSAPNPRARVRRVGLEPGLVEILRAHRRRQREDQRRAGSAWIDSGFVFTSERGLPVRPEYISDRFAKLCRSAGVPAGQLRDARHTAARLILSSDEDPQVASKTRGHADTRAPVPAQTDQPGVPGPHHLAAAAAAAAAAARPSPIVADVIAACTACGRPAPDRSTVQFTDWIAMPGNWLVCPSCIDEGTVAELAQARRKIEEKTRENRLRRMAKRRGLRLQKSRRRDPRAPNCHGFMLIDEHAPNAAVLRTSDLDDVETYLNRGPHA